MPSMPRMNEKTTKIAQKIMGVPVNARQKRTKRQQYINKRLVYDDTMRVR